MTARDPVAEARALLAKADPALVEYTLEGVRTSAYIEALNHVCALVAECERQRDEIDEQHNVRRMESDEAGRTIRALTAERDAERDELANLKVAWKQALTNLANGTARAPALRSELTSLRRENEELRGDKVRMDWLERHLHRSDGNRVDVYGLGQRVCVHGSMRATLREATDACLDETP